MSISKESLGKTLLALLAVVAAVGVYGELASTRDVANEPAAQAAASATVADLAAPAYPTAAAPEASHARAATAVRQPAIDAAERAAPRPRREARSKRTGGVAGEVVEEKVDAAPAEDPVAITAGAFAARLAAEPFDARWSSDAESRLVEHFTAVAGGRAQIAARCRSTVCRIDLAFESEAARDDGLGSLSLPWDSVAVFQVDERDPRNLIIHATRRPEDLIAQG
jgi:hypothetical protein